MSVMQLSKFSEEEIDQCLNLLEYIVENSEELTYLTHEKRIALFKACGAISRPDREEARKRDKDVQKTRQKIKAHNDNMARLATGIRAARLKSVFEAPLQIDYTNMKFDEKKISSFRNC